MECIIKMVNSIQEKSHEPISPRATEKASPAPAPDSGTKNRVPPDALDGDSTKERPKTSPPLEENPPKLQRTFWLVLQYAYFGFLALRFLLVTLFNHSSLPRRGFSDAAASGDQSRSQVTSVPPYTEDAKSRVQSDPVTGASATASASSSRHDSKRSQQQRRLPILRMRVWSCISNVLDLSRRMPWLKGMLKLIQHGLIYGHGRVGDTDGVLDRLVANLPLSSTSSLVPPLDRL